MISPSFQADFLPPLTREMAEAAAVAASIGLASNVLQFIDFGTRFVMKAWKIYHDGQGAGDNILDLLATTKDLESAVTALTSEPGTADSGMHEICVSCSEVASQLLTSLRELAAPEQPGKREALKAAFKRLWKQQDIENLKRRLDGFREQLVVQLLLSLRYAILFSYLWSRLLVSCLIAQRHFASASAAQQAEVRSKLGAVHSDTQRLEESFQRNEAVGKEILGLLTRQLEPSTRAEYQSSLQRDLLGRLYDSEMDSTTNASNVYISHSTRKLLERQFIARLPYDQMEDRELRIVDAHEATLRWIYTDPQRGENGWSNFKTWLESSEQLYWITGKPGSGKSTLIKYICRDDESGKQRSHYHQYLAKWADGHEILTAQFYFWNSGTQLQMSQSGLLRALLHQILSQRPSLIPIASPSRWEALCYFNEDPREFGERDLRAMLMALATGLPADCKLCLFVDGLDEFSGDHSELIRLFRDILRNSNIKLCVSSRPWVVFEDAFGHQPSLRLESLTREDIKGYVAAKFHEDAGFKTLRLREPEFAGQLIDNIVFRSAGVFLWVSLVVSSLLSGMIHGDRVVDLQRRLDLLPNDLEKLFERMLLSIDKFYLGHAAEYFAMVQAREDNPMTLLFMSYADEDYPDFVLKQPVAPLSQSDTEIRIETMRRRINSVCRGLLEISGLGAKVNPLSTVQYLHRTVKDYVESETAARILRPTIGDGFDAHARFCAAHLSIVKSTGPKLLLDSEADKALKSCADEAKVSRQQDNRLFSVLDELDRTGRELAKQVVEYMCNPTSGNVSEQNLIQSTTQLRQGLLFVLDKKEDRLLLEGMVLQHEGFWILGFPPVFSRTQYTVQRVGRSFLSFAVRHGLVQYVKHRAHRGCLAQICRLKPTLKVELDQTVWPLLFDAMEFEDLDHGMIRTLLEMGANPNFLIPQLPCQTPLTKALLNSIHGVDGVARSSPVEFLRFIRGEAVYFETTTPRSFYESPWGWAAYLLIQSGGQLSSESLKWVVREATFSTGGWIAGFAEKERYLSEAFVKLGCLEPLKVKKSGFWWR